MWGKKKKAKGNMLRVQEKVTQDIYNENKVTSETGQ